jgi:hypothetical protein
VNGFTMTSRSLPLDATAQRLSVTRCGAGLTPIQRFIFNLGLVSKLREMMTAIRGGTGFGAYRVIISPPPRTESTASSTQFRTSKCTRQGSPCVNLDEQPKDGRHELELVPKLRKYRAKTQNMVSMHKRFGPRIDGDYLKILITLLSTSILFMTSSNLSG